MSHEPYFFIEEEEPTPALKHHRALWFQSPRSFPKSSDWEYIPGHVHPGEEPYAALLPTFGVALLTGREAFVPAQSAAILAAILSAPSTIALDEAIDRARAELLALKENWDDADGRPYQAPTIDRAAGLLKRLSAVALTRGFELPLPAIRPADAGSVDLYWSDANRTLLINVPEDARVPATFSGRRGTADTIAGRIDLTEGRVSHLTSWLSE